MIGYVRQRTWSKVKLDSVKRRIEESKTVFLEIFDKNCNCGLYTLENILLDHMLGIKQRFEKLLVFDDIPYEHVNVHSKQENGRALQRRRIRMM